MRSAAGPRVGGAFFVPGRDRKLRLVTGSRPPVTGVSELVLEVAELERAERFYADVLGLPVVERWPHRDAVWVLAGEGTRIGLWKPQVGLEGSRGGEHVHFALHIEEEGFESLVERLRGLGFEVPVHDFGPLAGGNEPSRAAYVHDPDGHLVEFWTARMGDYLSSNEQA
jgi:catechol 2,3-dioxygenase-like lactoylglutathione lyase family enzyme